jgi:pectate lyase
VVVNPGSPIGFASQNGGTTGGKGGQTVNVNNYADLKRYAESSQPYTILISGTISNGSSGGQIRVASNKSLIGVGTSAFFSGVGIDISGNSSNVIVRNVKMTLVGMSNPGSVNGGDLISISDNAHNIWIDHNELYSENPDVQKDVGKYDGLIDIKGKTGFITLSYNYLHDHHKGGLVGAADDDLYENRKVTIHHNYYKNVKLRVPMYRGATGHFFNNYIVGARAATEIRANTCVRVERNYYEALDLSIYTPSESRGKTERIGNIEVKRTSRAYPANCTANIPYNYSSVLITNTDDVKTKIPQQAGVGKI